MIDAEPFPLIVARYCATDGYQINPTLFDEDAKFVVEEAACVATSNYQPLEPVHVLFHHLLRTPGLVSRQDRGEVISALKPHLGIDPKITRINWSLEGFDITDLGVQSFIEAKELADKKGSQVIRLEDLFPPTVIHTKPSVRHALYEVGLNLDELVINYARLTGR